jgi:hypothetical protein
MMMPSSLSARFMQAAEDADEVAAHGAADAAVVHLEHPRRRVRSTSVAVDAELAELVARPRRMRWPWASVRMRLSRVVCPAPR